MKAIQSVDSILELKRQRDKSVQLSLQESMKMAHVNETYNFVGRPNKKTRNLIQELKQAATITDSDQPQSFRE